MTEQSEAIYQEILKKGGYKKLDKTVYKFYNSTERSEAIGKTIEFINNISTNDMDKPKNAFTDPFGKLVVLFDQLVSGDDVFIVFNSQFEDRLKEHLKKYMKFTKTKMEKLEMQVIHIIGCEKPKEMLVIIKELAILLY